MPNAGVDPLLIIEALAAVLRDSPHVRLDQEDEVYRRLFATGCLPAVIAKHWHAVLARAAGMRAAASKPLAVP